MSSRSFEDVSFIGDLLSFFEDFVMFIVLYCFLSKYSTGWIVKEDSLIEDEVC